MAWPYPRTIPAEAVQRALEEVTFNFRTGRLTATYGEGAPSTATIIFRGVYSASVDYVANDTAYYGSSVWLCLVANGPSSSVVTPAEGVNWTEFHVTYDPTVNDAEQVYYTPNRTASAQASWDGFALVLSTVTEGDLMDLFYKPTGKLQTALVELYDYLIAQSQEPLPTP